MDKTCRAYLERVCKKYDIEYPSHIGLYEIQVYMEEELRKKGLDEYEIRQEFSSDWEVLIL